MRVQYSTKDSSSKLRYQRNMIGVVMVMNWLVCQCDSMIIDPPDVKNYTRSLIGYTNGSIEIDCDVNASYWSIWTKEDKALELGKRMIISREGRLIFKTLYKNDSGEYTCVAELNRTINNVTLLVVDNQTMPIVNITPLTPTQFPVGSYTLPEWMISVACVLLIATITIIIIVSYVNISKPRKGDISSHSSEMPENTETIEVFVAKQSTERSRDEECKLPNKGIVRQRKSSSTPKHDSYSIQNECLQEQSTSKKKKREKDKVDGRNEGLCSVEYIQEIPEKLGLIEGNKTNENRNVKSESRRSFAAPDIRDSLEQTTRLGDLGRRDEDRSKWQQEAKTPSCSVNITKQLNSEYLKMKYPPRKSTPERLKKTSPKPGQALRKIISDPCLMNRSPFPAVQTRNYYKGQECETAQGQGLKRVSSEVLDRADPIYLEPIIKGSLKLDKKSLRELKSKIQKSKSPAEILASKSKKKDKKFNHEAVSFTNEIYGTIEELRVPKDEPKTTVYQESEYEPIYEVIQVPTKQNKSDTDERCESERAERKESNNSLQNISGKRSKKITNAPKSCLKMKQSYEPKRLDFDDSQEDGVHLKDSKFITPAEENEKEHERCFENLSFSILEDLEEFEGDFDEEPNKVVNGIYQDIERQLPEDRQKLNSSREENVYEEIYYNDY